MAWAVLNRPFMTSRVSRPPPVAEPRKPAVKQPFKTLLDEARKAPRTPPGLTAKAVATTPPARAAAALVSAQPTAKAQEHTLTVGRGRVEAEADRLGVARAHHASTADAATTARNAINEGAEQKTSSRVVDLIVKELVAEFETRPGGAAASKVANPVQPISSLNEVPFHVGASSATPAQRAEQTAQLRANQAAALIERIDTFVKSQRPALALTLNNSLGARVEIEKLGPGRIALRLIGQNGPPTADTVNRIRDELTARGLKVGALSVA